MKRISMKNQTKCILLLFSLLFLQCVNNEDRVAVASLPDNSVNPDSTILLSKKLTPVNPDSAKVLLERLLEVSGRKLQDTQTFEVYLQLGIIYSIKKELDKSDSLYQRVLDGLGEGRAPRLMSQTYINLGINQSKRGHFEASTELYRKAEALIIKYPDECGNLQNHIYNNMGLSYQQIGKLDTANYYFERSYFLAKERGDKSTMANALVNLANTQSRLQEYEKTIKNLQEALPLYEEENNKEKILVVYSNLATAYSSIEDYEKALSTFEKADSLATVLNLPGQKASHYHNIGNIYYKKEAYEKSLTYAEKSLDIKRQFRDSVGMAYSLNALSAIYYKTGDSKKSKEMAETGLEIANATNHWDLQNRLYRNLSTAMIAMGEISDALALIETREAMNDSIVSRKQLEAIQEVQTKYETIQKEQIIEQLTEQQKTQRIISRLYIGLIVLLVIVVILSIIWMKNRHRKAEQQMIQLKYRTVKSKFIPHFTGNVLNSINYLISKNPDVAQRYIADFSSFTNRSLYNVDKLCSTLEDEVEYVKTYLELEKLRFEDDLNYTIRISSDVDTQIAIPTMILHTFCENALKHGLRHKSGGGMIMVDVYNQEKYVVISVEDDGLGRKKAGELKTEGSREGLKIVEQQMVLFNKGKSNDAYLKVVDLFAEDNMPAGTRFEFYVPF